MGTTIFLAKLFGLYLIITSSAMLLNRHRLDDLVEYFFQNPALYFLAAIYNVILGLILVLTHNIWVADWTSIITALSWLVLVKGISWLYFPSHLEKFSKWAYPPQNRVHQILLSLSLFLGVFLTYKGFFS